jgi:hypothetical protein
MPTTNTITTAPWAREFFDHVRDARRALERAEKLAEIKRDAALSIPDSLARLGSITSRGSHSDPMRAADEAIDAYLELRSGPAYEWARSTIRDCETVLARARATGDGTLVLAADIADLTYLHGYTKDKFVAVVFVSRATLYRALTSLERWMDAQDPEHLTTPL